MPRTRKADKTPTPSVEPPTRPSRKRRASSAASDVSAQPTPSASQARVQNKRRKKGEASQDEEDSPVLTTEDRLEVLCEQPEDVEIIDATAAGAEEPAERHVHFTETSSTTGDKSTSTHLTPHFRKTTVHRRVTLSPASFEKTTTTSTDSQTSKPRASLPPVFSFSPNSPATKVQELQFAPLSQILDQRIKSRLNRKRLSEVLHSSDTRTRDQIRREKEEPYKLAFEIKYREDLIKGYLDELEVHRQLGTNISDETAEKIKFAEEQIIGLRREIAVKEERLAALPQVDGADEVDHDMMVFNGDALDVSYPDLSEDTTPRTRRSTVKTIDETIVTSSQIAPDANIEAERQAFETAIKYWTREASDAKAALQILTIELQSLGFGGVDITTETIISSIRESFLSIRGRLEAALPGQVPADLSNGDLVELIIQHVEALAEQVANQEQALRDGDQLQQELVREINGLLERLSDAEIKKQTLEKGVKRLDDQGQEDEVFIAQLEDKLKEIAVEHGIVQNLLNEKNQQLILLQGTNVELESTVDKLGLALDGYRTSEVSLQALITKLEETHQHTITDIEINRKRAIDDLEAKLAIETIKKDAAETAALGNATTITTLELRIEEDAINIEALKEDLAAVEAERLAEQEGRELAEGERDDNAALITELEAKIERAETDLEALKAELTRLRDLHEAERRQREAAEADLDDRNIKITELDQKLHEQGIQANQLRQKLFEIQMREKEGIKKLEADALDREEQFQDDMAVEIARREEADATAAARNVTILQLEESLRETEETMRITLLERDETIVKLIARTDQLAGELTTTQNELDTALNDLELLQTTSEARIADLVADITDLQQVVAIHLATIKTLESQALTTTKIHDTAITDRDTHIAELNHTIFTSQTLITTLESEKSSLERRVEAEAEQMLELQISKDDEIAALKRTIGSKHNEVENLARRAQEVDRVWDKLMQERDDEIAELQLVAQTNVSAIAKLSKINVALKEKFRKYVRDSTAAVQAMKEEMELAASAAAAKSADLRAEGMRVLEEVEEMDEEVVVEVQTSTTVEKGSAVKRFKRGSASASAKGKRVFDSGIGVEDAEAA